MSITVRQWSEADLNRVINGDRWLTTVLANATSFSVEAIRAISSVRYNIKHYEMMFALDDEPRILKATDDEMMLRFIDSEFTSRPIELWEVVRSYRKVAMS